MAVDYEIDCVVAGAGAIGLAIARELAQAGREVLILESEEAYGRGVSSRSSEVIQTRSPDSKAGARSSAALPASASLSAWA